MIPSLHKDFKLNGISFESPTVLLSYVEKNHPEHLFFLQNWFDNSEIIKVSTSGSTGKPKNIGLEKIRMVNSAEATAEYFNLKAKTKALICLSSDYIAGKMMWVRALQFGWHIDVVPVDSSPLAHNPERLYDFSAMVPLQVQASLNQLNRVSKLIVGGGVVSESLLTELKTVSSGIYQTYGMTETITHVAVRKIVAKNKAEKLDFRYKALPNVILSVDERKCLVINAYEISKNSVITNDIVHLFSENEFEWLGRYDNVINSGAVKLFPEQIEKKLMPFIKKPFFIAGLNDDKLGEKTGLFIESLSEISNLSNFFEKAGLTRFEKPKTVFYLQEFVRTNSKINRKKTVLLSVNN